mgnify:FL=1
MQLLKVVEGHEPLDLLESLKLYGVAKLVGLSLKDPLNSVLLVLKYVATNV